MESEMNTARQLFEAGTMRSIYVIRRRNEICISLWVLLGKNTLSRILPTNPDCGCDGSAYNPSCQENLRKLLHTGEDQIDLVQV